jgi:hypothetical protein
MDYIKLKIKDKSAQDMIEFTFVLPLLIFCFVFILTGGQLIYNKFVAFNAVYNGMRQASVEPSLTAARKTLKEVADEYLPQTISVDRAAVTLQPLNGAGDIIDVLTWQKNTELMGEIVYVVNTLFPFRFNFKSSFNGQSTETMFLAPNQMKVSAKTVAYIEYNKANNYTGNRIRLR